VKYSAITRLTDMDDLFSHNPPLSTAGIRPSQAKEDPLAQNKAIGGKEGKGSRRIFVRLQGATAGA
jgi:hypothetical protein